jgi:glycosyltransferase involved in cell wall biosynthesis
MRIALVSEHASPLATLGGEDAGGQNVHVAALATELGRRGHEVVVHTRRDDRGLPKRVPLAPNVVVHHIDAGPAEPVPKDHLLPFMDEFAAELFSAWVADQPVVVHAHFWMSGKASLAAAEPLRIPVVQTFHALGAVKRRHQGSKDTSPPERLAEEIRIVERADAIAATCTDEVFELLRLGAEPGRLSVVPCGVDVDVFRPDGAAEPRTAGRARFVCLGRLVERKGVADVLRALTFLPDAELVVAGGPETAELAADPEACRLLDVARELGVADRVQLRGRIAREDVAPLLRSADAVVCAPWYEPFGIVPLEAMACGVPVVVSAVGGMVDSVVHEVTGLHVPPRDPEALAAGLARLLDDAPLGDELGAAGVERVRSRYTWAHVAAATLEVYAGVLAPASRSAAEVAT